MPAESSKPFTTRASDSCSESNTFTSFSLGSGRGCVSADLGGSGMKSPILNSESVLPRDFTPDAGLNSAVLKQSL